MNIFTFNCGALHNEFLKGSDVIIHLYSEGTGTVNKDVHTFSLVEKETADVMALIGMQVETVQKFSASGDWDDRRTLTYEAIVPNTPE